MWESLGFVFSFAYSTFLCLEYKVYIMLAVLLLTAVTTPIIEYHEYKYPTKPEVGGSTLSNKTDDESCMAKITCQTPI